MTPAAAVREIRARLTGCRFRQDTPFGTLACTLKRGHDGQHEAWSCTCAGDGRCLEPEVGPVGTWA